MKLSTAIKTSVTIALLVAAIACGATRQGRVGVEYEKHTPVGTFKGKVITNWDFNAPDNSWCGCITFLGEDGKPMPNTPKGEIAGGRGGGVVPKGAVGWKVELSNDCDDFDCNPEPKPRSGSALQAKPSTLAHQWLMIGSYQGFDFTDTIQVPTKPARFYEYSLTVTANSKAAANKKVDELLNNRSLGLPVGVDVHEFLDLLPTFDSATGILVGWTGEFLDDEPMSFLALHMNGQAVDIHPGQSPYSGVGYWAYPVAIPASAMNVDPTYNASFSNILRKQWNGTSGMQDQSSELSWTVQ